MDDEFPEEVEEKERVYFHPLLRKEIERMDLWLSLKFMTDSDI